MWPSLIPFGPWATILTHWTAAFCWLRLMGHPLFRRAIRGHWRLDYARRVSIAHHLSELAQYNDVGQPALKAYMDSFRGSKAVWWFRIINDLFDGKPGKGLPTAIKGEFYEFVFDATAMKFLWAQQSEWRGF